jgi:hypothetical protein
LSSESATSAGTRSVPNIELGYLKSPIEQSNSFSTSSEVYLNPKKVPSTGKLMTLQECFDAVRTNEILMSSGNSFSESKLSDPSVPISDHGRLSGREMTKGVSPSSPQNAMQRSEPGHTSSENKEKKAPKNDKTKTSPIKSKKTGEKRSKKASKLGTIPHPKKASKVISSETLKSAKVDEDSSQKKQPTKLVIKPLTSNPEPKALPQVGLSRSVSLSEKNQWSVDSGSTVVPDNGMSRSDPSTGHRMGYLDQKEAPGFMESMSIEKNQNLGNGPWGVQTTNLQIDIHTPTLQELQMDALSPPDWHIKGIGPVQHLLDANGVSDPETFSFISNHLSKRRMSDEFLWLSSEHVPVLTPVLSQNMQHPARSTNEVVDYRLHSMQSPTKKPRNYFFVSQSFPSVLPDTHSSSSFSGKTSTLGQESCFSFSAQSNGFQ